MFYICNKSLIVAAAIAGALVSPGGAFANNPVLEPAVSSAAALPTPVNGEALRTALIAPNAVSDDALLHYEATAYRGVWFDATGDASKATALLETLKAADAHALPIARYKIPLLEAALNAAASGAPAAVAAAEIALTNTFLTYARDLSSGVLEPRRIDRDLHVFPERPIEQALLADLSGTSDVRVFLAGLAPRHPHYTALQAELVALNDQAATGAWGDVAPTGGSIRLGQSGPRVEAVRARLAALGNIAPAPATDASADPTASDAVANDPAVYDEDLERAVIAFQARHGLNADGVIGKRTIKAMNRSAAYRAGQVVVNMERLRWLNRDLGDRHIMVNQADFNVKVVDRGQILFDERVIIGKARKHRTPEFSDQMTYLVLNPTWHVPYSIASKEILPELQADPEYITKKNMQLLVRGEDGALDSTTIDWSLYSENDFPYVVKQRPGGGNALGRVKFMFPNKFNIYLHDTPSKSLFRKDARAFSHGCVRVQDPLELARVLLAPQVEEPIGYIDRILGRYKEKYVNLSEPVQVHLTYRTAWVDETGVRQFRDDVYGRDARILAALQAAGVQAAPEG